MINLVGPKTLTEQAYALANGGLNPTSNLSYWLLPDPRKTAIAAELLAAFLPKKDAPPVITVDLGQESASEAIEQLLSMQTGIVLISIDDFCTLGTAISLHAAQRLVFRVGQRLNPVQVKRSLTQIGYGEHEGEYGLSARGGTLDVRTPKTEWRIVFSEEGIESIIDLKDQGAKQTIVFPPANIDLTVVPEKSIPVPRGDVIIDQVDEKRIKKALSSSVWAWVTARFMPFGVPADESSRAFHLSVPSAYKKHFSKLASDIKAWQAASKKVVLYVLDAEVLETALRREELDTKTLDIRNQVTPMQGFIDTERDLVVLSHADIFGRRAVKKQARRDESAFITSLKPNDFIVHEDHGVGRYLGLVSSMIEGHTRENLLIEYAKNDRLYVPVELAYKVDRYVGEAKPALQRLSGTSWIRLTRKASFDSQAFAKDLLAIYARRSLTRVDAWHIDAKADAAMHKRFGYQETTDQEKAIERVYEALSGHEPMDQLVVGDVGFGKTEVAIRAAYQAVLNKKQVVILCPTTLLAQQHFDTFRDRFTALGVRVEMLSRFTGVVGEKSKTIKGVLAEVKEGNVDIVIGTHRLLSADVAFNDLGLIVVDEEQRFGVRHKERLKGLRTQAHILTLSATPIPRTLYFSLSGLRDISTIQTPPKGRQAIETSIEPYQQERVKEVIEKELARGGQVFYLYNHVQTIHTAKRRLQELLGAKVRIAIVHGQMPEDEMARVAEGFDHGRVDVLVCTTIIENGLDLPNVNTLIVENATRFGLGQLYQIRGRVGRGQAKAFAYFMYPQTGLSGIAAQRLHILQEAKELGSGFELAMRDLEMRGMGQLIGKRQHGHIQHVGLSMYGRLLRQAVEEIESGEVTPPRHTVTMSLPLDYGIPEALIANPETRSRLYRQLSGAEDTEAVQQLLHTYTKAIRDLSPQDKRKLTNLEHVFELRALATTANLTGIDYQERELMSGDKKTVVQLDFVELKTEHLDRLEPLFQTLKAHGNSLTIDGEEIKDFYHDIKRALKALV